MDMQVSGGDRSGKMALFALVAAVVALVVGVIGIARGVSAARAAQELGARLQTVERRLTETSEGSQNLAGQMNNFVTRANETLSAFGHRIMAVETDVKRHEEKLTAPPPPPAPARAARAADAPVSPSGRVHEVKEGDTLGKIAKQYGVSLADLMKLNPDVDPARMRIGLKIALP